MLKQLKSAKRPTKKKSKPRKKVDVLDDEQPKSFWQRFGFQKKTADLSALEMGTTTILDIISPSTVDTRSRDYIIVDEVLHAYLYITGYGYETSVRPGWLSPLVEAGDGISLNYLVQRQSKEKILAQISQAVMLNRSRMRDVDDTRQDFEELGSAISSGLWIKNALNQDGEDFYYMHVLIEVIADDPQTLAQRVSSVENLCTASNLIARRCDYKNEQAFLSMLPLAALTPDIERKAKRNAITSSVAAAFPFTSYELSDKHGVFLGLNLYNRSPVFLDFYNDFRYINGNTCICGTSGAGKTYSLQLIGGRLRLQGKQVIYIMMQSRIYYIFQ